MPKNFAQKHHFILAKLLKFQETFLEKFLVSGFGADAPTDNTHKKARRRRAFYLSIYVGTAVPNLRFKGLFVKSPLKIRKNFRKCKQYHSSPRIYFTAFGIIFTVSDEVMAISVYSFCAISPAIPAI